MSSTESIADFMLLHHLSLWGHVGLIHILHFLWTEQIKQDLQGKNPKTINVKVVWISLKSFVALLELVADLKLYENGK